MVLNGDRCQFVIIKSSRSELFRGEGSKTAMIKVGNKTIEEQCNVIWQSIFENYVNKQV